MGNELVPRKKDKIIPLPEAEISTVIEVQPRLDGEPAEPVNEQPEIDWEAIPVKIERFDIWGKGVIDEVSYMVARYERYEPLSWKDADENHKKIKKTAKWAGKIRAGWNEQLQKFVAWKEFCPAEHLDNLIHLQAIVSERIMELKKVSEKLYIQEGRLEAFVDGRW